jgi:hypothetical protein
MTTVAPSLAAVLGFSLVHLFSVYLRFLEGTPRSIWLSIAGGVSGAVCWGVSAI